MRFEVKIVNFRFGYCSGKTLTSFEKHKTSLFIQLGFKKTTSLRLWYCWSTFGDIESTSRNWMFAFETTCITSHNHMSKIQIVLLQNNEKVWWRQSEKREAKNWFSSLEQSPCHADITQYRFTILFSTSTALCASDCFNSNCDTQLEKKCFVR